MYHKGWRTIESFTRNDPAFVNSTDVWRNFSEPWDMAEHGFKLIKEMGAWNVKRRWNTFDAVSKNEQANDKQWNESNHI